ncbi:hypothetical protein KBD34_00685 [Patescibacteria group bacterium]|nr:hypothetical protein [Patescibacteria group bacterium]
MPSFFRGRFGFFMVGIVLVVCAILLVRQRFFPSTPSSDDVVQVGNSQVNTLTPVDPTVLHGEWKQAVQAVLADYDQTGDARSAKERLLTLRVPASGRDTHLALFLALNDLAESRPNGKARLAAARTAFVNGTTAPVDRVLSSSSYYSTTSVPGTSSTNR